MEKCPKCHNVVINDDKFCPHCGNDLTKKPSKQLILNCTKCGNQNPNNTSFCETCGNALTGEQPVQKQPTTSAKRIVSAGSYSGKMTTGKSKLLKRLIIAAVSIVVVSAIAIIIWFQVDNNAEEKLKEAIRIPGAVVLIGFAIYVAIFGKSKKRRRHGGDDDNWDHNDDDGDWGDDGGDDD